MKALFVFAAAGMVALVSCDRHDWNETKKLHEHHALADAAEHGEQSSSESHGAAAGHAEHAAAEKEEHSAEKSENAHEKAH